MHQSIQVIDDGLRAANSAASAFPPLQAALGLVLYIEDSVDRFKSNRTEIKDIAEYSKRLSEQLMRHRSAEATKTENYVQVIEEIRRYVEKVSNKNSIVQYFEREHITKKLQEYRNGLWEEFAIFSITSDVNVEEFQREAEVARQADQQETQRAIKDLSDELKTTSAGVRRLSEELGLSSGYAARKEVLRELQAMENDIEPEARSADEAAVLRESIHLSRLLLAPTYRWFSETFNSKAFTQSEVKNSLAEGIEDVLRDLADSGILSNSTMAELNYERNELQKVAILFRVLNLRSRDAILIRSFQWAVFRVRGMESMLREGLELPAMTCTV